MLTDEQNFTISPFDLLSFTKLTISSASGVDLVSWIEAITFEFDFSADFINLFRSLVAIDNSMSTNVTPESIAFCKIPSLSDSFPAKKPPSRTDLTVNTTGTGMPSFNFEIEASMSISEKSLTPHSSIGGIFEISSPSSLVEITGSGLFKYSLSKRTST